jgi:hypothetical protein
VATARNLRRSDTFWAVVRPVIYADQCRGFIVPCGDEFRVFDSNETSLGVFVTEAEAVAALFTGVNSD